MELIRDIGWRELIVVGVIGMLYLLYVINLFIKARRLNTSPVRFVFKLFLRTAYVALILIAIMGPSFGKKEQEVKAVAKDIYVAFDLSRSMLAEDVQPNRLEKAKFELKRIIKAFQGDKVGLIIFSSQAFVQCPITYDHAALSMFIETLNTSLVPNAGTDLQAPLELALEKHMDDKNIKAHAKVIIVISDGEDFSDKAVEVAEEIKENNMKLFALGVGSKKGSKIPQGNGFKKDKNGNEVISKLNKEGLLKLTTLTGGKYFEINPSKNETEVLINSIKKIKGEERDARKMDVSSNKYFFFLLPALILIGIDGLFVINILKLAN